MSPVKSLRHRIEYIAFLSIAGIIRALPLDVASRWSGAVWRLVAPRLRRHQRAVSNLTLAFPEKSPEEIERIALGMWDNLGRTFAEFFHLQEIVDGGRVEFETPEHFDAVRTHGGGMVACGLHMANWEITSQAALRVGARPAGVYQKITNPLVDEYINLVRAPYYPGGLMEKSSHTARALLRYAREGGCAAFLADQREGRGVDVMLFGRPAPSATFPAQIARAVKVPLYVCRAKRIGGARFSLRFEPVVVPHTDDREADVAEGTRAVQATFERMIREAPEQWMWAHRRWR